MSAAKSLPGLQELRALANLINHSIDELEQVCVSQGKDIPLLSEPADRQAEAMLFSPEAIKAGSLITAAAAQLAAATRPSLFTTVQTSFSVNMHNSVLKACTDSLSSTLFQQPLVLRLKPMFPRFFAKLARRYVRSTSPMCTDI